MLSKFENWKRTPNGPETDPPWGGVGGGVGGWLLMMIGDAMTPLTPRLTPSSMLFNIEFDVTVFDVTHLYHKNKVKVN